MNRQSRRIARDTDNIHSVARWLTITVVLLIIYGSLFPFHFTSWRHFSVLEALRGLRLMRSSRGDLVANLLLYMPLGLCLLRAWPGRWSRVVVCGLTVVCGTLLSLAMEMMQTLESTRVSGLTDVVANAAGTVLGVGVGAMYGAIGARIRVPGVARGRAEPVPLGVIALWLAFRLAPFVPTLDWQKYKAAVKPLLLHPQLTTPGVFRYMVGWLVVAEAVRQIWKREFAAAVVAGCVAIVLLGRLVVISQSLSINEMAAVALLVPVGFVLRFLPERVQRAVVVLGLAAVLVVRGLEPFRFLGPTQAFSWVPFKSSLSGPIDFNYTVFLEKCFWYSSLVWLLARVGASMRTATLTTALLLLMIEVLQVWQPDHSAEITDPLLAIIAGVLIGRMGIGAAREPDIAVPHQK